MKAKDIKKGNSLLKELKGLDMELSRINQLASILSTEKIDICVRIELIKKDTHESEITGHSFVDLYKQTEASTLHTHTKESEMLEIFGIMIAWRNARKKAVLQELKLMDITQ